MKKFRDAFNGLKIGMHHKAVIIQCVLGTMAVIGGLIIKLDHYEWLAFVICIMSVISMEIMNTSVEMIGNYLNMNEDPKIKAIKDLSSAAVLVSGIGSLIVCILCLIRRI
ncbi:MAG: diacylglycerol kinase [Erysipelotrichaceae bacterium]|nr:diacylglycerol kinase [Erysipelotrichaceae bacterium]